MRFDLSLNELQVYKPPRQEPDDFDTFWRRSLEEARQFDLDATFELVDYGLVTVDTFDATFSGYGGQRIKSWFLLPKQRSAPLPCIIEYIGYGGGRGFPTDWLFWASMGYAYFVMDTRGQGSAWRQGDTPDLFEGSSPHHPGFMTLGILDPHTYYYRRLFVDAVRALDAVKEREEVHAERLIVTGASQGGGVSLAVAGLVQEVSAVMPDVPFLCHYRRATEITDNTPYAEIAHFCKIHRDEVETVFQTLSYFDGVNFASRAKAKALFSVALMDLTCPPSTVFAAFNHYAGGKDIRVYPYNDHEGGESFQRLAQVRWLREGSMTG